MTNYFVINCHGGLLGDTSTPARFSFRRGRGRHPYAAVEAIAGGAQDDNSFLTSSHGGLLG